MRGGPSLKGKGGLVGFRKNPSLMVKRDGVILEKIPPLRVREDWWVFERIPIAKPAFLGANQSIGGASQRFL